MTPSSAQTWRRLLSLIMVVPGFVSSADLKQRDHLRHIVEHCINADAQSTECRWPNDESVRGKGKSCEATTRVWNLTHDFVAIRDRKMCECTRPHGLAMPRWPVAGIGDANLPEGIWQFAWRSAIGKFPEHADSTLALLVNSKKLRSQDQLHLHFVLMQGHAAARLRDDKVVRSRKLASLDHVWEEGGKLAKYPLLWTDYGIVLAKSEDGYVLHVTPPMMQIETSDYLQMC